MKASRCRRRRGEIALHVAGDLPPRRAARLDRHLASCADCHELAERLVADRRALGGLASEPLAPQSLARVRTVVLRRVEEDQAARRGAGGLFGLSRRTSWALSALAAAFLAAALGLALWPAPSNVPGAGTEAGSGRGTAAGGPRAPEPVASQAPPPFPAAPEATPPSTAPHVTSGPAPRSRIAVAGQSPPLAPPSGRAHRPSQEGRPQPAPASEPAARQAEPLLIQVVSDQPDIVYYWLTEPEETLHERTSE